MAYTYNSYVDAVSRILNIPDDDTDYRNIIPRMIEYAENRIYRECDFLATLSAQTTSLTAASRITVLPATIIVCQSINVVTPASTPPDLGVRNPLNRVSIDFLTATWPSAAGSGVPKYYAIMGAPTMSPTTTAGPMNIMLGPVPDAAYAAEVIGTVRPAPLSFTNQTTFLSTCVPDLFLAASMIWGFGYQRDFGGQADDPATAQSWEHQYESLRIGIDVEEMRKKSASVSWSPYHPTPTANTQRERAGNARPS
jgi:hypothetical protein